MVNGRLTKTEIKMAATASLGATFTDKFVLLEGLKARKASLKHAPDLEQEIGESEHELVDISAELSGRDFDEREGIYHKLAADYAEKNTAGSNAADVLKKAMTYYHTHILD